MKKLTLLFLLITGGLQAQFFLGMGGFYSEPLGQFKLDNYQHGFGFEMGLGYQFTIKDPWRMELNTHWQWGNNGVKRAKEDWGSYKLDNDFTDWHGEIKLMYNTKHWIPYIAGHAGMATYETLELFNYDATAIDDNENTIHERDVFQWGFTLGSYLKLTESLLLDLSVSTNFGDQGVNFFDIDSYSYNDGNPTYTNVRSRPCLLLFNFGLQFELEASSSTSGFEDVEVDDDDDWEYIPSPRPSPSPRPQPKNDHKTR